MRVALFSGNYNYLREGANRALNKLVGYLEREADCTIRVYSPVTDTPAFEPEGTLVPVASIALPVRSEFRLALGLPRSVRDDLCHFAPDIVHVSTPDLLGLRAQSWAIRQNVPILASMHTLFESYLEYYRLGWLRPVLEGHLHRFYRRADYVVGPTPALVAMLHALRGDACASVWSRGIDRDMFSPGKRDMAWRRAHGIQDDEVAVLFFGRLVLEKGIDVYREVLVSLQAPTTANTNARICALVIGAGPARSSLNALGRVVLTGHLDGDDLARAVASADIMLAPSTTETFGQVVLEAMASGLPVVSADAPSSRALIEGGKTGILCRPTAIDDYVAAIEGLAAEPGLRKAMGDAARSASAAYSWDAASQSVAKVYRALIAQTG